MLKFPKNLNDHPRLAIIEAQLTTALKTIWPGGKLKIPHWDFDEHVKRATRAAMLSGNVVQGLENCVEFLNREKNGLDAAKGKHAVLPSPRLSRFLLVANDGSERFYHDAESMLVRHAERTFGAVLAADAATLGQAVGSKGPIKALLIVDKIALGLFLADAIAER